MDREDAGYIVDDLFTDMIDRSGIGDEFAILDEQVKQEMRDRWIEIIMDQT